MGSLRLYQYPGRVALVNPRYEEMFGQTCYPSVDALPETPEAAVLVVGAGAVVAQAELLVSKGCRRVVVVSNGFAETGSEEGRQRELALRNLGERHPDLQLIGPNCVGFASFHESLCAIAQPTPPRLRPGGTSVLSQSGGLTAAALGALGRDGVGIDMCYSLGNGTAFSLGQAIALLARRPTTQVICAVIESLGRLGEVEEAMAQARDNGKEMVFLLLGRSEGGKGVAQSHTGMVVGEQQALSAWVQRRGGTVVSSPDELAAVAHVLQRIGRPQPGRRPFVATVSGGGAGLAADLAARGRLDLAQLDKDSKKKLEPLLPPGAWVGDPLDIATGDVEGCLGVIVEDPNVGLMVEPWMLPWPDHSPDFHWQRAGLERLARVAGGAGLPVVIGALQEQALSDWAAEDLGGRPGVCVSTNLERTLAALAYLYGSQSPLAPAAQPGAVGAQGRPGPVSMDQAPKTEQAGPDGKATHLIGEVQARPLLQRVGLPVVTGATAATPEEAVSAARQLPGPWAVKLAVPGVAHKERVGGVRLGITSPEGVMDACRDIAAAAAKVGLTAEAEVAFLVTQMVFGPELLVGAVRDPLVGPNLTVAVGGWAAESGAVFGTVALPADEQELSGAVSGWRLPRLLGAARAAQLVGFLSTLCVEFATGGLSGFQTVEINPLVISKDGPLVVDALLFE